MANKNPYAPNFYGQCTWFAWGRFYEMYGYSPGFLGDGWKCVDQLLKVHPDKFKRSDTPEIGAVFSCVGRNHVGIVVGWDDTNITIQEGNLDGKTNTFAQAKRTGEQQLIHLISLEQYVEELCLQSQRHRGFCAFYYILRNIIV